MLLLAVKIQKQISGGPPAIAAYFPTRDPDRGRLRVDEACLPLGALASGGQGPAVRGVAAP